MNGKYKFLHVQSTQELAEFVKLPYRIYQKDPFWVPPLDSEIRSLLNKKSNPLLKKGPHEFLLLKRNNHIVARLGVGIDENINQKKDRKEGWITLFESIPDYYATETILDYAVNWLKERGMDTIVGPVSPTKGDDFRGMMIQGYGSSPVIMSAYNPSYYPEFFERYGFEKDIDFCAYYFDLLKEIDPKLVRGVRLAKQRYGFEVFPLRKECIHEELLDIKKILDEAMPADWPHLVPPEMDELKDIANQLLKLAEPSLVNIARHGKRPIGFAIALPDYNQVLKHLRGKLFPFGFIKFFWYRRKITGARSFVNFVVPDFQKKGVSASVYLKAFEAGKRLGYTYGEGSYIGEWNLPMRRDAEGAGGILYKMYRIYEKKI